MRLSLVLLLASLWIGDGVAQSNSTISSGGAVLPGRGLCAHRGAMTTHPENTLAAFREAIRCGAHMIEFDVQSTRDKQLVIMHDPTVNRTTNGKGKVADLTFEDIRRLDAGSWKAPAFKGEKVPTLKETLDIMPRNIWLNIHLKGGTEAGKQVATALIEQKRLQQAFLACDSAAARGAQAVAPAILICNMERQKDAQDYVAQTIRQQAAFIQLTGKLTTNFPGYVKALKQHGIHINYFGAVPPEQLPSLFDIGIEFPLVNDLAGALKAIAALGLTPIQPVFRH